jgi:hypothetical protein
MITLVSPSCSIYLITVLYLIEMSLNPAETIPLNLQASDHHLDRVDFGSPLRQKKFFSQARQRFGDWQALFDALSKMTHGHLTLRKLKRWRLGQALPVLDLVQAICLVTGQDWRRLSVEIRPANWGQRKGGNMKLAEHGCNLTLQNRMKGGRMTGRSNGIMHMRTIASVGGAASIKANRHPFRRVDGPNGIRMLDELERDVMAKLFSGGIHAVYEPVVRIGLRRLIPDFRVGATYIECTHNRQVNVKSAELKERFRTLKEHVEFGRGIVVTHPSLVSRYKQYLPADIEVTTAENLQSILT